MFSFFEFENPILAQIEDWVTKAKSLNFQIRSASTFPMK